MMEGSAVIAMLYPKSAFIHRFTRFDPRMGRFHPAYPRVAAAQLEPGPFLGWMWGMKVGDMQLAAGAVNRTVLVEGAYTPGMLNFGWILDDGHDAVVKAHAYNGGTLGIDGGNASMHEVYPAGMPWAAIQVPPARMVKGLEHFKAITADDCHLMLTGPRADLNPILECIHTCMSSGSPLRGAASERMERRIQAALHNLIATRLRASSEDKAYAEGDKFLMQIIERSEKLLRGAEHERLTLDDICKATRMNGRTLQKYFHAMYGVGPVAYFRRRRLNATRASLMDADPLKASVGDIAHNWGFTHLGRYALDYRKIFGESPSQTLSA